MAHCHFSISLFTKLTSHIYATGNLAANKLVYLVKISEKISKVLQNHNYNDKKEPKKF